MTYALSHKKFMWACTKNSKHSSDVVRPRSFLRYFDVKNISSRKNISFHDGSRRPFRSTTRKHVSLTAWYRHRIMFDKRAVQFFNNKSDC